MKRFREGRGTVIKIEGPASMQVLDGAISVLGSLMRPKERLVVPKYKSVTVEFVEDSTVELRLGNDARVERLNEVTVPSEWGAAAQVIVSHALRPIKCIVMGDVDSGKTIFCTYLANYALNRGFRVGIIDKDPGQTEISVPTTIGLGIVNKPVYSLEQVEAIATRFIGSTSPANVVQRVIVATRQLYEEALSRGCDLIVINTSGWISGQGARELKYNLVSAIHPQYAVLIQRANEVEHLIKPFEKSDINIIRIQPLPHIKPKTKEERKARRESMYRNYFSEAKVRKINLSSVRLMFTLFTTGARLNEEELKKYGETWSIDLLYGEESKDSLFLVSKEPIPNRVKVVEEAKKIYGKEDVVVTWPGEERGLIVGLLAPDLSYLGLGLIREIDYVKRVMEILTPVEGIIGIIQVGLVRLDEDFREVAKYQRTPL